MPLIALGALGALIALIFGGTYVYHASGFLFGFGGESPAERVALTDRDLPAGMTRCPLSEHPQGKGGDTQFDGASDAVTVIYADDCNVPPARRYAFSWVVESDSATAAVAAYTAFVGSQDCTIAHGCVDWGLGQNFNLNCGTTHGSNPGIVSCLGTWQRNAFMVTFQGIMGSLDESKKAVLDMDARAHQIPAPAPRFRSPRLKRLRPRRRSCAASNPRPALIEVDVVYDKSKAGQRRNPARLLARFKSA